MRKPGEICVSTDPLFASAHSALMFAFHFNAQIDRPVIYRLAKDPDAARRPPPKGLGGLDGAAQSGMIRAEVSRLSRIRANLLIARIAPHALPCSCRAVCCSGRRLNREWSGAIDELARFPFEALAGCLSHYRLRRGIIVRYFGERVRLGDLADECGVNRDTASDHNARITKHLKTEEYDAWSEIHARMDACGLLGAGVGAARISAVA